VTVDQTATQHLVKAKEYLAKGEEFYRHAAAEIELAKESGATWTEIGDALDRSDWWCQQIVNWAKTPANSKSGRSAPFGGEDRNAISDNAKAKRVLSDPERVQSLVNALPKEAVYEVEKAVANRLGAPITQSTPVDPGMVVRAFDALPTEERERVVQDIVQHKEFAEAVKANPVVRDEMVVKVMGTPAERKERAEETQRTTIKKNPLLGWTQVNDGLADANRGLLNALDALTKLILAGDFDPDSDPLGVSHSRAQMIGRSVVEIEAAWGHTPITDKIEELRGERV